jgi:oligoribonuclease (3'-5' exoribonuclease)
MNVNEMSKLDLEKALIAGEKDPELKHQILNRLLELDNKENMEQMQIMKEINEKVKSIDGLMDLISNKVIYSTNINKEELEEIKTLIKEMKIIMENNDVEKEQKLQKVLKKGINLGSQIAIPLLTEYIKEEAKKYGIF